MYKATAILGESTHAALEDAEAWLVEQNRGDTDAPPQHPNAAEPQSDQPP